MTTITKYFIAGLTTMVTLTAAIACYTLRGALLGGMVTAGVAVGWWIVCRAVRAERDTAQRAPTIRKWPLIALAPAVARAILPVVIGVGLLGGGAVWIGLKIWSKIASFEMRENAKPVDRGLAAITSPTTSDLGLLASPHTTEPATTTQPPTPDTTTPEPLGVSQPSPGIVRLFIPPDTTVEWSRDTVEWYPLGTYPNGATNDFDATLEPVLLFRSTVAQP